MKQKGIVVMVLTYFLILYLIISAIVIVHIQTQAFETQNQVSIPMQIKDELITGLALVSHLDSAHYSCFAYDPTWLQQLVQSKSQLLMQTNTSFPPVSIYIGLRAIAFTINGSKTEEAQATLSTFLHQKGYANLSSFLIAHNIQALTSISSNDTINLRQIENCNWSWLYLHSLFHTIGSLEIQSATTTLLHSFNMKINSAPQVHITIGSNSTSIALHAIIDQNGADMPLFYNLTYYLHSRGSLYEVDATFNSAYLRIRDLSIVTAQGLPWYIEVSGGVRLIFDYGLNICPGSNC